MTIATLHDWAVEGGYSEKEFQRDWYVQHPEIGSRRQSTTQNKISDCPVDLILPPDVLFDEQGITLVEKARGKGKEPRYFKAAATPIVPTMSIRALFNMSLRLWTAEVGDGTLWTAQR